MAYKWERLQVGLTTLLAVAAIALAAWEGIENRQHNHLSVAPRLNGSVGLSREAVSLGLSSNGLGPAVIKEFRIYLDGKVVHDAAIDSTSASPWQQLMPLLAPSNYAVTTNAYGIGSLLRAGQDYEMFRVTARDSTKLKDDELSKLIDRIGIEVRYCSMYDDQCEDTYVGLHPPEALKKASR